MNDTLGRQVTEIPFRGNSPDTGGVYRLMAMLVSRVVALICVLGPLSANVGAELKSSTGVNVLLPHACGSHGDSRDLVVRYLPGGRLWLNAEPLDESVLRSRVQADLQTRVKKLLWVEADEHVPYGEVVEILSKLRRDNPDVYLALATKAQTGTIDPADPEFQKAQLNPNLGIYSLCVPRLL
jgi:biopolymer transport protein ExbD